MDTRTFILIFAIVLAAKIGSTYQQLCVINLDMVIIVDGSNSMGKENFETQKRSMINLVLSMNVSDSNVHVGVVLYSGGISAVVNLTGNQDKIVSEIEDMVYPDEETRTDLGIDKAYAMLEEEARGRVPKLMILITDGASSNSNLTIASAARAKNRGITIFAIGVTDRVDVKELNNIASEKNKGEYQVFVTEDFSKLEGSLNNATYRACVDLQCQDASIDIAFVLDSSSNINSSNFLEMKNFVHEFLMFADVDSGEIRVGVVTFSNTASVQFYLNTYRTKSLMTNAINNVQYTPGNTNIVDALRTLTTSIFTRNNGDRSDVPNVAIILSANAFNVNTLLASEAADATRAAGIQIYGIAIGHPDTSLMDGIVSRPQEDSRFMVNSFLELRPVIPAVYSKFNKFCQTPQPIPTCAMGATDVWFVAEVSKTAETLSRFQYTGDFAQLKLGLTTLVEIVQDPSVPNPGVRIGLVGYSDVSRVFSYISQANSVNNTASALQQLPGGINQLGADLVGALQNIVTPPVVSNNRSYVAVVAPESSYAFNTSALYRQLTRLKDLGYVVVIFAVRENGMLDQQRIQREASGPRYFYYIPRYSELEAAAINFTRDGLCGNVVDNSTGLCAESGYQENGVGVVAHPTDCDKYIQCYYNERGNLELGVVRQCPMGLHWNSQNKTCSLPSQARCGYDHCKEACQPYKMEGSCKSYWDCEDGVSVAKCCPQDYAFVPGLGCQPDTTCKDLCGPIKSCGGICQRKPNWINSAGYDVMIFGGNMWMPRPCSYDNFDIVDCDCTATRGQVCPADRVFDFSDGQTVEDIEDGKKDGIRVYDVQETSGRIMLGNKSAVHIDVNHKVDGKEPFALHLRFRESNTFSPYGETLVSSGVSCGNANSLIISGNDQFISAVITSSHQTLAEVKVPLNGLNKDEFKDLVLSYDNKVLALSIKDEHIQYIAKTPAPSNICLACGLDIGRGVSKLSFVGEIQKIAVYSCSWPLMY